LARKLDGAELGRADPTRAAGLFEIACRQGDQEACHELAVMLAKPRGLALDRERAQRLEAAACDSGIIDACRTLAESSARVRVLAAMRAQCDSGTVAACEGLAQLLDKNDPAATDLSVKAATARRKRCEQGKPFACRQLASQMEEAKPPDPKRAAELRQRALDLSVVACRQDGDADACATSADWCGATCTSGSQTYSEASLRAMAVEGMAKLCEAGDSGECREAGLQLSHLSGQSAEARASSMFRRACDDGWADACESAVLRVPEGRAGKEARVSLNRQGCLLGNESACARFGEEARPERVANEENEQEDEDEPPELVALRAEVLAAESQACRKGDWESCTAVADKLEEGEKLEEARALLELACDTGVASACSELGYWHEVLLDHGSEAEEKAAVRTAYLRGCAAGGFDCCEELLALTSTDKARAQLRPLALRTFLGICQDDRQARAALRHVERQADACVSAALLVREETQAGAGLPEHGQLAKRALEVAERRCEKQTACSPAADILGDRRLSVYDPARALELRKGACNAGYVNQCLQLARQYAEGEGVAKDAAKAQEILTERCRKHDSDACQEMTKRGWPMPGKAVAGKPQPMLAKRAPKLPTPREKIDLPFKLPGCPGEYCGCIVSDRMVTSVTLLTEPEEDAPALVELAHGTRFASAEIFELIHRPGVVRLGGTCDDDKPGKPGPPVHYLGYAGEGEHVVFQKGRKENVDDCEIMELLSQPDTTTWVEITTLNGKTGYTPHIEAVQRGMPDGKESCM
jgi:TPR repeat protein